MSARFGIFEFDPSSGELRRDGTPVKLQAQPAAVLRMLVASPGQLVTREQLREAVWGAETHVDFDRGLNVCVAQIRTALNDSADSPRFIKTHLKKGYEFIAPITAASPDLSQQKTSRRNWSIAAGFGGLLATIGLWTSIHSQHKARIAVARFDNETGDPNLDRLSDAVGDLLVDELTAAGNHDIIGNAAILRVPRAERNLNSIGDSLGARYVVLCQLQNTAPPYRLLAHLIRLPEQTHLKTIRVEIDQNGAPAGAKRIASEFSARLAALHNSSND